MQEQPVSILDLASPVLDSNETLPEGNEVEHEARNDIMSYESIEFLEKDDESCFVLHEEEAFLFV